MGQHFSILRKQLEIYEKIPKDTFDKLKFIEKISQEWYLSRINNSQASH
jgi:hypothetical protein